MTVVVGQLLKFYLSAAIAMISIIFVKNQFSLTLIIVSFKGGWLKMLCQYLELKWIETEK